MLITASVYELHDACQNIRNLEGLYGDLGLDETPSEDAMADACDPQPPGARAVWESVKVEADGWYGSVFGDGVASWPAKQ